MLKIISIGEVINSNVGIDDLNEDIKSESDINDGSDDEEAPLKKRLKRKRKIKNSNSSDGYSCNICDFVAINAASLGKFCKKQA